MNKVISFLFGSNIPEEPVGSTVSPSNKRLLQLGFSGCLPNYAEINFYSLFPLVNFTENKLLTGSFVAADSSRTANPIRRQIFLENFLNSSSLEVPIDFKLNPIPRPLTSQNIKNSNSSARKSIRAYEMQSCLHLTPTSTVIDMTSGMGDFCSAASRIHLFVPTALCVYDFPDFPVPKVPRAYNVLYHSYKDANFSIPHDWYSLTGSKVYDVYYFNASPSYSLPNILVLQLKVALSIATYASDSTFVCRIGHSVPMEFLVKFISHFSFFDIIQFSTCHTFDLHLVVKGFSLKPNVCPSILIYLNNLQHLTSYPPTRAFYNYFSKVKVYETPIVRDIPNVYLVPPTQHADVLFPQFTEGRALIMAQAAMKVPYIRDMYYDMCSLVSVRSDFFGKSIVGVKPVMPLKHLKQIITSSVYEVSTTQMPAFVPTPLQAAYNKFVPDFEHKFFVPQLNMTTFTGSIITRLDQDLDEDYDPSALPFLLDGAEDFIDLFSPHVNQELPSLFTMIQAANLTSSVGVTAKKFCPGAKTLGDAVKYPNFIEATMNVIENYNKESDSVFDSFNNAPSYPLEYYCFSKNGEVLPVSPTKIYMGLQVPRLLVFKGGHLRLGIASYFYPILSVMIDIGTNGFDRPFPYTSIGETPMLTAKRICTEFEKHRDPAAIDIDVSTWDATMQFYHQVISFYIFSTLIPAFKRAFANFYFHEVFKVIIALGTIILGFGFKSTGTEDNTLNNTQTHYIVMYAALKQANCLHLFRLVCGDDGLIIGESSDIDRVWQTKNFYNRIGMRLRKAKRSTCPEHVGYSSHGYHHLIYKNDETYVEFRSHVEVLSRLRYIWASTDNQLLLTAKLGSYFFLYYYTIEIRLIVLAIALEASIEALIVKFSTSYYLRFSSSIANFDAPIREHYGVFNPDMFIQSNICLPVLYDRWSPTTPLHLSAMYTAISKSSTLSVHLPSRNVLNNYIQKLSSMGYPVD